LEVVGRDDRSAGYVVRGHQHRVSRLLPDAVQVRHAAKESGEHQSQAQDATPVQPKRPVSFTTTIKHYQVVE